MSRLKTLMVIVLAAGALALSATSSPAGAAPAKQAKAHALNCISSCADYEATIDQYFSDVAADSGLTTNVYSVVTQYSNIEHTTTFGGSYVDESPYPIRQSCTDGFDKYCVTDARLQQEIAKVIAANNWPNDTTTALYFIFTPANVGVCFDVGSADSGNACTTNAFCAYHAAGVGLKFIYAVVPDAAAAKRDCIHDGQSPAGNHADPTINAISHEHIEAITDPYPYNHYSAWWSEDHEEANAYYGNEIADLCKWNFGSALGGDPGAEYNQVINGHDYWLQQEWSNADGGCVQHAGGTVANLDPNDPLYEGVGPLVDHGGAVMTTNTVYAIYWVSVAPANAANRPPKIAGLAKVGRKLSALPGAWSNSLSFSYRWLRCSAARTSCKGIRKATRRVYTLVPADAGHRVKVRVTATNTVGHASATSAPTRKVRP